MHKSFGILYLTLDKDFSENKKLLCEIATDALASTLSSCVCIWQIKMLIVRIE
jgi:hypothetical protein